MTNPNRICAAEDCQRPLSARGLCNTHYHKIWRQSRPRTDRKPRVSHTDLENFMQLAARCMSADCLIWPYAKDRDGYGRIKLNGRPQGAHRVVCQEVNGPPPDDKPYAAHLCGNGHLGCVNGSHLEWKDAKGNAADSIAHGRTIRGVKMYCARLDEAKVRIIWENREITNRALAVGLGVSASCIDAVRNGRSWSWLTAQWGQPRVSSQRASS